VNGGGHAEGFGRHDASSHSGTGRTPGGDECDRDRDPTATVIYRSGIGSRLGRSLAAGSG